jgi:hypothetical protein
VSSINYEKNILTLSAIIDFIQFAVAIFFGFHNRLPKPGLVTLVGFLDFTHTAGLSNHV